MKKIKKIVIASLILINANNIFAESVINDQKLKDDNFYLTILGGANLIGGMEFKEDSTNTNYNSQFGVFGQVGFGFYSGYLNSSFELNYIKPLDSKLLMKEPQIFGKAIAQVMLSQFNKPSMSIPTETIDQTTKTGAIYLNPEEVRKYLETRISGLQTKDEIKGFIGELALHIPEMKDNIRALIAQVDQDSIDESKALGLRNLGALPAEQLARIKIEKAPEKIYTSKPINKPSNTKTLPEIPDFKVDNAHLELNNYHIAIARINIGLVNQEKFSVHLSAGAGISYFGGEFKYQAHTEVGSCDISAKLKEEVRFTGLVGLGLDYKISNSISLLAQYDLVATQISSLEFEKPKISIKVGDQVITEEKLGGLGQSSKMKGSNMYNHNFGVGIKIQF